AAELEPDGAAAVSRDHGLAHRGYADIPHYASIRACLGCLLRQILAISAGLYRPRVCRSPRPIGSVSGVYASRRGLGVMRLVTMVGREENGRGEMPGVLR